MFLALRVRAAGRRFRRRLRRGSAAVLSPEHGEGDAAAVTRRRSGLWTLVGGLGVQLQVNLPGPCGQGPGARCRGRGAGPGGAWVSSIGGACAAAAGADAGRAARASTQQPDKTCAAPALAYGGPRGSRRVRHGQADSTYVTVSDSDEEPAAGTRMLQSDTQSGAL